MLREYTAADFDPPLSDDAVIMLKFVQEKKRKMLRLQQRTGAYVAAGFLVGLILGHFIV